MLYGNPGHRKLPVGEPEPRRKMPRRPGWLTGEAKALWDQEAPRLHRLGLLTEVDGEMLARLCHTHKRYLQAEESVERSLQATGRLNRLKVVVAHKYLTALNQLAASFGLSPAGRARIQLQDRDEVEPDDEGILS